MGAGGYGDAETLRAFAAIVRSTACPFAPSALMWGCPASASNVSFDGLAQDVTSQLRSLVDHPRAAEIDGLVMRCAAPFDCATMGDLASSFARLLTLIVSMDADRNETFVGPFLVPGWQFSFAGVRFFISVFSPLYAVDHQRHSPSNTFIVFQPESSFRHHKVGGPYKNAKKVKADIRRSFAAKGFRYLTDLVNEQIEAPLYLMPRDLSDVEAAWWLWLPMALE